MSPLTSDERKALLNIARLSIEKAAEKGTFAGFGIEPGPTPPQRPSGVFVTLRRSKQLRGCIGQLDATMPLPMAVAFAASSAALEDPRFQRVQPEEVPELTIEISVLTPFQEIAPEKIVPGTHGLVIQHGVCRGLLLPQVATEHGLSRERFLEETCAKAGLPRDAWRDPTTHIYAFTAEVFSEEEEIKEKNKNGANKMSAPR